MIFNKEPKINQCQKRTISFHVEFELYWEYKTKTPYQYSMESPLGRIGCSRTVAPIDQGKPHFPRPCSQFRHDTSNYLQTTDDMVKENGIPGQIG